MAIIAGLSFCLASLGAVGLLKFMPAPTTAFMLRQHIVDFSDGQNFRPIRYRWVGRRQISTDAFSAVIASEDQRFFQHHGFDLDSIYRAIDTYLDGGRLRGASTISQQVAKNLFLSPDRSFWRKGLEAWFTALIELLWSKQRILEMYLNIAQFGDHLFGIEAAARHYFGIPARRLDARQAALLAATLPNPLTFKANRPSPYLYQRRNWILKQMRNLNIRL